MSARGSWAVLTALLAAGACIGGSGCRNTDQLVLEISYLEGLASLTESAADDRDADVTALWRHETEILVLIERGEPRAVELLTILLARGRVPGGCSCDGQPLMTRALESGPPPGFWCQLDRLATSGIASALRTIDESCAYSEHQASSTREDDRAAYLSTRPQVKRRYEQANPAF